MYSPHDIARADVEATPEHDLRRLLERMAVTDPSCVSRAIARMRHFDAIKRNPR